MIYVHRNPELIPEKVLKIAERAQKKLEMLQPSERASFIEKKKHIWRKFAQYLNKMSYGKCWYSESDGVQAFRDVDHFRPKNKAIRAQGVSDEGYPWLAFSWENFRYAAQRSNQINTDEANDSSVGKGAWFPLCNNSPIATWANRCVDEEKPVLLDPTDIADVRLIDVGSDGRITSSKYCHGEYDKNRVRESVKLLGLDLPDLVEARKRAMRDIQERLTAMNSLLELANSDAAFSQGLTEHAKKTNTIEAIKNKTRPNEPYAKAIRAALVQEGFGDLCLCAEEG